MKTIFWLSLTLLLYSSIACATEEYAHQTGQSCAACHVNPSGGGELTAYGKTFAATLKPVQQPSSGSEAARGIRFAAGYLHLLTAFLWFGTILYVHLVLKPAYASSGLPRGEMRVGILSMVAIGITGVILAFYRITSPETLLHTRFGILLIVKVALYLTMVISAIFVITVIGPRLRKKRRDSLAAVSGDMTPEELAGCDGKEGRPACLAFQGTVYDVTTSRLWKQGLHMGRHQAGVDLTEMLAQAPHGADIVIAMPSPGRLLAGAHQPVPLHERVFFFMAYMNLAIVFLITLILALWRWW